MLARWLSRATGILPADISLGELLHLQLVDLEPHRLQLLVLLHDRLRLAFDLFKGVLLSVTSQFLHTLKLILKCCKAAEYDLFKE